MLADKVTGDVKDAKLNFDVDRHIKNRQKKDRRREPNASYTYISAVGWIDRRERLRRKNDSYNF